MSGPEFASVAQTKRFLLWYRTKIDLYVPDWPKSVMQIKFHSATLAQAESTVDVVVEGWHRSKFWSNR